MAIDDPMGKKNPPASMSMIEPRLRDIYISFYKESYFKPSALDLKTKELIAIGCSLVAKCEGCLEGHIKKALELGATRHQNSDAIVVAEGIWPPGASWTFPTKRRSSSICTISNKSKGEVKKGKG